MKESNISQNVHFVVSVIM